MCRVAARSGQKTHCRLGPVVSNLDVVKSASVLECGNIPVKLAQPRVDIWVVAADRADVALEPADVRYVEANLYKCVTISKSRKRKCGQ